MGLSPPNSPTQGPTDITEIPDIFGSDEGDQQQQDELLNEITGNALANIDKFDDLKRNTLKLSLLKKAFNKKDERILNFLSYRWAVEVDDEFCHQVGAGKVMMDTNETMLDYHLTVANCLGFSALLPNAVTSIRFSFEMDLKKHYREFKGKHGMVGFDTRGRMLYVGKCMNEDVFLAMAPKSVVTGETEACHAGHSSGSTQMSRRHLRMVTLMLLNFLPQVRHRSFQVHGNIYDHEIDKGDINWRGISSAM